MSLRLGQIHLPDTSHHQPNTNLPQGLLSHYPDMDHEKNNHQQDMNQQLQQLNLLNNHYQELTKHTRKTNLSQRTSCYRNMSLLYRAKNRKRALA
uniref:MamL-1 domain-containing protein n=1 Tax=Ascaris lumbricoides TaxID=6252 RepID=A0A0M3HKV5_ASCLU